MLGRVVGAVGNRPPYVQLTDIGKIAETEIHAMQTIRKNIILPKCIIMPNHVHMIVVIKEGGRLATAPTLSEIVRLWKREISKQTGLSIWQKSYHDHIIRDEVEYNRIAQYIDENPALWQDDCYYTG